MYVVLQGQASQSDGIYFGVMPATKARREQEDQRKTGNSIHKSKSNNNINNNNNNNNIDISIISNRHHSSQKEHKKLALLFRLQYVQKLRKCVKKVVKMTG